MKEKKNGGKNCNVRFQSEVGKKEKRKKQNPKIFHANSRFTKGKESLRGNIDAVVEWPRVYVYYRQ